MTQQSRTSDFKSVPNSGTKKLPWYKRLRHWWFRHFSRANRTICLFVVLRAKDAPAFINAIHKYAGGRTIPFDEEIPSPIAVTATHEDALMAIDRCYYLNHVSHYVSWCEQHNYRPQFRGVSWVLYKNSILSRSEEIREHSVVQLYYRAEDIAALMRAIMPSCAPLFLPYENTSEWVRFVDRNLMTPGGSDAGTDSGANTDGDNKPVLSLPSYVSTAVRYDRDIDDIVSSALGAALARRQQRQKTVDRNT